MLCTLNVWQNLTHLQDTRSRGSLCTEYSPLEFVGALTALLCNKQRSKLSTPAQQEVAGGLRLGLQPSGRKHLLREGEVRKHPVWWQVLRWIHGVRTSLAEMVLGLSPRVFGRSCRNLTGKFFHTTLLGRRIRREIAVSCTPKALSSNFRRRLVFPFTCRRAQMLDAFFNLFKSVAMVKP